MSKIDKHTRYFVRFLEDKNLKDDESNPGWLYIHNKGDFESKDEIYLYNWMDYQEGRIRLGDLKRAKKNQFLELSKEQIQIFNKLVSKDYDDAEKFLYQLADQAAKKMEKKKSKIDKNTRYFVRILEDKTLKDDESNPGWLYIHNKGEFESNGEIYLFNWMDYQEGRIRLGDLKRAKKNQFLELTKEQIQTFNKLVDKDYDDAEKFLYDLVDKATKRKK